MNLKGKSKNSNCEVWPSKLGVKGASSPRSRDTRRVRSKVYVSRWFHNRLVWLSILKPVKPSPLWVYESSIAGPKAVCPGLPTSDKSPRKIQRSLVLPKFQPRFVPAVEFANAALMPSLSVLKRDQKAS